MYSFEYWKVKFSSSLHMFEIFCLFAETPPHTSGPEWHDLFSKSCFRGWVSLYARSSAVNKWTNICVFCSSSEHAVMCFWNAPGLQNVRRQACERCARNYEAKAGRGTELQKTIIKWTKKPYNEDVMLLQVPFMYLWSRRRLHYTELGATRPSEIWYLIKSLHDTNMSG